MHTEIFISFIPEDIHLWVNTCPKQETLLFRCHDDKLQQIYSEGEQRTNTKDKGIVIIPWLEVIQVHLVQPVKNHKK